jgi:hypothetical protein
VGRGGGPSPSTRSQLTEHRAGLIHESPRTINGSKFASEGALDTLLRVVAVPAVLKVPALLRVENDNERRFPNTLGIGPETFRGEGCGLACGGGIRELSAIAAGDVGYWKNAVARLCAQQTLNQRLLDRSTLRELAKPYAPGSPIQSVHTRRMGIAISRRWVSGSQANRSSILNSFPCDAGAFGGAVLDGGAAWKNVNSSGSGFACGGCSGDTVLCSCFDCCIAVWPDEKKSVPAPFDAAVD